MVQLGEACCILWGKHHGKKVWLNAEKQATKLKYHIVVENDDGTSYTKTTAYKYMVCWGHFGNPKSKHEAAFEQIPELEEELNTVTIKLAKCNIKPSKELSDFILEHLKAAVEHQHMKGSKATWFCIVYNKKKRAHNANSSSGSTDSDKSMTG